MMGAVRITGVFLLVCFVNLPIISGKPFFGFLYCDLVCDDYDDGVSTSSSTTTDFYDDMFCRGCPTTTTTTPRPFNFVIPQSANQQNVTFMNVNGNWIMSVLPMPGNGGASTPAPATTAAATTVATTAATTAAAGATTAAATTAAG